MDNELFQKALELSDYDTQVHNASLYSWTRDFLKEHDIPSEVVKFFETYSFNRRISFNNVVYDGNVNSIVDNNLDEENSRCLSERLLIIGYGLNGDLIVIDLNTLSVGYVFHDDLWENKEINPREIFIDLKCTVGQFYYNAVTVENYPVDGYDAEEYLGKSKE